MDIFLICLALVVAIRALESALSGGDDDPSWELQWRALDSADRARLAAAGLPDVTRSERDALVKPEEVDLMMGFRRREIRRRAYVELAFSAVLIMALALLLAGVLTLSNCAFILVCWTTLSLLGARLRDRQVKRALEAQRKVAAATAITAG